MDEIVGFVVLLVLAPVVVALSVFAIRATWRRDRELIAQRRRDRGVDR